MRLAAVTASAVALSAVLLLAGCGGGTNGTPKKATAPNAPAGSQVVACEESAAEVEGLRAAAVDCGTADRIMRRWRNHRSCALAAGASRGSCALGGFRCQAVRSDRGIAVSCARPGGDVSFVRVKRGAG